MPFFGPSLAGRSNSTTGTPTLTRWAAICAPITPAPSTATLRTLNRFMTATPVGSLHGQRGARVCTPRAARSGCGRAAADVAAHLEHLAAVARASGAPCRPCRCSGRGSCRRPSIGCVGVLLHAVDDGHAQHRLVLALVGALVAHRVRLGPGRASFSILPLSTPAASVMRTSDFSCLVSSSMVFHRPTGRGLRERQARSSGTGRRQGSGSSCVVSSGCVESAQNSASSMSISGLLPARAVRISIAVSGSSLAK